MAVLTFTDLTKIYSISPIMHIGVAGMIATLVPAVAGSFAGRAKYYGDSAWKRDPAAGGREAVDLNELDRQVLDLLRFGHTTMAEITDALQVDSGVSNASVERLDRGGYIVRRSLTGAGFYVFDITAKGRAVLPPLPSALPFSNPLSCEARKPIPRSRSA